MHRGTPLYGQPAWWGDEEAEGQQQQQQQQGRSEEKNSERKREKAEAGMRKTACKQCDHDSNVFFKLYNLQHWSNLLAVFFLPEKL